MGDRHRWARRRTHDPLTRVLNRSAFEARATRRTGAVLPVALMILDIDDFRNINSIHGHPAGDTVLLSVVNRLREVLRTNDLLGRYGGDEFMALCLGVGPRTAVAIAQRITEAIAAEVVRPDGVSVAITASIGIACTRSDLLADDFDRMVKRADAALLRAKLGGKNRVMTVRVDARKK